MKLTTKGRYAIIAMVDLTMNSEHDPVSLKDVSARHNISLSYLEQLFARLRAAGLVKSYRGPGGGYSLNKEATSINLLDVITAVDENMDQTQCSGAMNCIDEKPCLTHYIWIGLNNTINQYMKGINLNDVALREDVKNIIFLREKGNVNSNQRQKK